MKMTDFEKVEFQILLNLELLQLGIVRNKELSNEEKVLEFYYGLTDANCRNIRSRYTDRITLISEVVDKPIEYVDSIVTRDIFEKTYRHKYSLR